MLLRAMCGDYLSDRAASTSPTLSVTQLVPFAEPHSGFRIAFNMFDTDGNQRVDKNEFLVVSQRSESLFTERITADRRVACICDE